MTLVVSENPGSHAEMFARGLWFSLRIKRRLCRLGDTDMSMAQTPNYASQELEITCYSITMLAPKSGLLLHYGLA